MWLGEKITDKGIGNGISLLIMVGIIATFASVILYKNTLQDDWTESNGGVNHDIN